MWDNILATLIAAAITGPAGYFLRKLHTKERFLPGEKESASSAGYESIEGERFLFYFTHDPKINKEYTLAISRISLTVGKDLLVSGTETVEVQHRRALAYDLRGEIRAGQLFMTGVCTDDPSEAYTVMFPDLLDDQAMGILVAKDYARRPYVSPILLSKKHLTPAAAEADLLGTNVNLYPPTLGSSPK